MLCAPILTYCIILRVCSVRWTGAGSTWRPRRSSPCTTTRNWRAKAGWGAAAARRMPGMEAAHCCWMASSLLLTHLQFLPRMCVFFCSPLLHFHLLKKASVSAMGTTVLCVCCVSCRIFSLHVPLPHKTLVSLIYKPSAGITVSLELKTTDASLCTHMDVQDVKCEFFTVRPSTNTPTTALQKKPSYN